MVGSWKVTIHSTIEGILTEQWTVSQDGSKITGTVKTKNGDGHGRFAQRSDFPRHGHGWGQEIHYSAALLQTDFDGTIRMGKNEFLLSAKRSNRISSTDNRSGATRSGYRCTTSSLCFLAISHYRGNSACSSGTSRHRVITSAA